MAGEWFRTGWRTTLVEEGVVHATPVGDLVPHELTDDCVCGPRVVLDTYDDAADGYVYVHASLDGREQVERSGGTA